MARPLRILFADAYDQITVAVTKRKKADLSRRHGPIIFPEQLSSREIYDVEIHAYAC